MPGVGIATRHGLVQVGLPRLLARRSGGGGSGERPLRALINGTPRAGPGRQDRRAATTPHPRQPGQEPPGQGDPAAEDRRPSDALAHRGPGRCGTRLQPSRAPSRSRRTRCPARRPVPGRRTPPHAAPAPATGSDDFRSRTWGGSGAWWCDRLAAVSSWSGTTGRSLGRGCTWERRAFVGRIRYFVGILRILADRQDRVTRSHVRRPPCAHMGARQLILTDTQKPRNYAEDSRLSRRAPPLPCATPFSGQAAARAIGADTRPQRLPQQDLRYDRARGNRAHSARYRPCGLVRPAPPGSRRNVDPGSPPMGRVRRRAAHGRAAARPLNRSRRGIRPISVRK